MTGMETAAMIPSIMSGADIRDTPPWARMSAGTRSSAMTETAPASSAILACSGVTTSMITPPRSISANPRLTRAVPTARSAPLLRSAMEQILLDADVRPDGNQLDPGDAGGEEDGAGGVGQLGRRGGRGAGPAA